MCSTCLDSAHSGAYGSGLPQAAALLGTPYALKPKPQTLHPNPEHPRCLRLLRSATAGPCSGSSQWWRQLQQTHWCLLMGTWITAHLRKSRGSCCVAGSRSSRRSRSSLASSTACLKNCPAHSILIFPGNLGCLQRARVPGLLQVPCRPCMATSAHLFGRVLPATDFVACCKGLQSVPGEPAK